MKEEGSGEGKPGGGPQRRGGRGAGDGSWGQQPETRAGAVGVGYQRRRGGEGEAGSQ
jgi:hypothetical protein